MTALLLLTKIEGTPVPIRVLVVDDEAPIRRLLSALLKRSLPGNLVLKEAASGEEALLAMREAEFDLIVSDYRMGAVSGVDVLETAAAAHARAARVLVTGYADVPVAVDGVNRGQMDGFVPKPWDNDRFVSLIARVLDRTSGRRSPGDGHTLMRGG